jgi:hypothetical protein
MELSDPATLADRLSPSVPLLAAKAGKENIDTRISVANAPKLMMNFLLRGFSA